MSPRPVGNFTWTDEAVATLKRMVADGDSFGQISRALGCSRCAANGKATRLGAPRPVRASAPLKAPPVARAQYQNAAANFRQPKPTPAPTIRLGVGGNGVRPKPAIPYVERVEPAGKVKATELLNHHCRWPIGDPASDGFRFCGDDKERGSYCGRHGDVAYRAAAPAPARQTHVRPRRAA